jgi:hypothetical protein
VKNNRVGSDGYTFYFHLFVYDYTPFIEVRIYTYLSRWKRIKWKAVYFLVVGFWLWLWLWFVVVIECVAFGEMLEEWVMGIRILSGVVSGGYRM